MLDYQLHCSELHIPMYPLCLQFNPYIRLFCLLLFFISASMIVREMGGYLFWGISQVLYCMYFSERLRQAPTQHNPFMHPLFQPFTVCISTGHHSLMGLLLSAPSCSGLRNCDSVLLPGSSTNGLPFFYC